MSQGNRSPPEGDGELMSQDRMLPPEVDALWNDYQVAEARLPRQQKLARLDAFISKLLEIPIERWSEWALSIAREHSEVGKRIEVRMPLFRWVLFPALLQAIERRTPGAARWLAALAQHLYRAKDCQDQLPAPRQTEIGLLLLALEHDPDDNQARLKLIDAFKWQLDYAIHEIPAGVLYGHDGATIEQCGELQATLDTFCGLVDAAELGARYESLIQECRFHFRHYAIYLANSQRYDSYAGYLAENGAE